MVFDFLTRLVEEVNALGVSEAHAFLMFPKLLTGRAERHLRSIRYCKRSGGVTCWSEVVNLILRTYATAMGTHNAINDLRNIFRKLQENKRTYSGCISDTAHRCGNVYDEV